MNIIDMMRLNNITQLVQSAVFAIFVGLFANNVLASYEDLYTQKEVSDPLEWANRKIYGFNLVADKYVMKPTAKGYRKALPQPVRTSVRNFLTNLKTPLTILNSMLQLDFDNSLDAFWRFSINSTIGIGGLFDVATDQDIEYRPEDFGQTLGHYGIGAGPFLMLPILGPSNLRDTSGLVVDAVINPVYLPDKIDRVDDDKIFWTDMEARVAVNVVNGIDTREKYLELIDEIEKNSFDSYSAIKTMYNQRRKFQVRNESREE